MRDWVQKSVRVLRGLIAVLLPATYFCYVFQAFRGGFLTAGLSTWLDPYYVHYLLEHWYYSVIDFRDPASPPMYFPARGTLGYSVGLILYAPFYLLVRPFLHPFPAHTLTLLLVMLTGSVCLYGTLRKFIGLGFLESLLLTAFFFSSGNVINELTNAWPQNASVFLVPPILLLTLVTAGMPGRRSSLALAGLCGLLWSLLLVQDFYTGAFTFLLAALLAAGVFLVGGSRTLRERLRSEWRSDRPRVAAFGAGGLLGILVFLRIYLPAYGEQGSFPKEQLTASLIGRDVSGWREPFAFVKDLVVYRDARTFQVVFLVGILALIPYFRVPARTRRYVLWFLLVSTIIVLVAVRFEGVLGSRSVSVWKGLFAWIPGFGAIRDPKRIINVYELAAALLMGLFLAALPRRSPLRVLAAVCLLALLIVRPNREVFTYERSRPVFDRWVAAPIAIDRSCRSFFIRGASDAYTSRYPHIWGLYSLDAMFIALYTGLPTLNGYSAWWPRDWPLMNPLDSAYSSGARQWIAQHRLEGVCELDIEARTMKPLEPIRPAGP